MDPIAAPLACPEPTADPFALRPVPTLGPVKSATKAYLRSVRGTLEQVEADLRLQTELRAAPAIAELVGGPDSLPRLEARIETLDRARAELTAWLAAYRLRQASLDAPRPPIVIKAPTMRPRAFRRARRRVASTSNTSARGPDDEPPPARGAIFRAPDPMFERGIRGGRRDG